MDTRVGGRSSIAQANDLTLRAEMKNWSTSSGADRSGAPQVRARSSPMRSPMTLFRAALSAVVLTLLAPSASAQRVQPTPVNNPGDPGTFRAEELVDSGTPLLRHRLAASRWPCRKPSAAGASQGVHPGPGSVRRLLRRARYGEGRLYTRNAERAPHLLARSVPGLRCRRRRRSDHDARLQHADGRPLYQRFVGIDGSAYLVGGFGVAPRPRTTWSWSRSAPASAGGSASTWAT